MTVEITARHERIGATLQAYARKKAETLCADFPRTESVRVVLDVERHLYRAEFVVTCKGTQCVGMAEAPENMVAAIDEAVEKVTRQLRKLRSKKVAARHAAAKKKGGAATPRT